MTPDTKWQPFADAPGYIARTLFFQSGRPNLNRVSPEPRTMAASEDLVIAIVAELTGAKVDPRLRREIRRSLVDVHAADYAAKLNPGRSRRIAADGCRSMEPAEIGPREASRGIELCRNAAEWRNRQTHRT